MNDFFKQQEGHEASGMDAPNNGHTKQCDKQQTLVYICSPYSGAPHGNTKKAISYSRFAVDEGVVPIAPHLLLPLYMDEEKERDEALSMDLVILGRCDELWVFGDEWSAGMKAEIREAGRRGMKIRYFSKECREES